MNSNLQSITVNKEENLAWFRKTIEILEKHNLWYVVDCGTLLGTIRHQGPIPWDDDFDILMSPESYAELKKLYPENCLDGISEETYPLIFPKFVPNRKEFLTSPIFVDIFLIVPTTKKRISNFCSFRTKVWFSVQCLHSKWHSYGRIVQLGKVLTFPFKVFYKSKLTYLQSIHMLEAKPHTNYFTVDNPVEDRNKNTLDNYSFKRVEKPFLDMLVKVPFEYDAVLRKRYGDAYMTPQKWHKPFVHINAISIRKKTKQELE